MMAGKPDCNLLKTNDMRPLKTYCTPSLRSLPLQTELSFLTSGAGEDAHPEEGRWNDETRVNAFAL